MTTLERSILGQITTAASKTPLERIGYGSCGTVWADPSDSIDQRPSSIVIKRGDGLPDRSISNECEMHTRILATAAHGAHSSQDSVSGFRVNIPRHIDFLSPSSPTWPDILPRMPEGFTACQALISERIMPLPRPARQLLVQKFWAGDANAIVDDKRNEHCLIRPYLGRRRVGARGSMFKAISLRNYPLHVDQLEELGLPTTEYASAMADALAFLLWAAKIDACDVEFVLGRPRAPAARTPSPGPQACIGAREFTFGPLGPHALWILDFDCCRSLPMSTEGVHLAAERFWRNDPFYPNPDCKHATDRHLWEHFRDRFLETSGFILHDRDENERELPRRLVSRIIETVGAYTKGGFR